MNDSIPHHAIRPREIELIREMNRGPLSAKKQKELDKLLPEVIDSSGAFITMKAGEWLKLSQLQPEAASLFDSFWFEGELCMMFADTNVGKSILAVQIGDSISRGQPIGSFGLQKEASTVLYFDFELSARQFGQRYASAAHGHYQFDPKFLRAELNPDSPKAHKFKSHDEYVMHALENSLYFTGAKILIIDNITCLASGTHSAASALKLMRKLQAVKKQYGLSVLVLAHTPKRNPSKPITRNDLHGSKMIINFCDSAFAIGESRANPGQRYVKQIKQRNGSHLYGAGNVCLCSLGRQGSFLQFHFSGNANEAQHLQAPGHQNRSEQNQRVIRMRQQGLSLRQIATDLGMSNSNVHRILQNHAANDQPQTGQEAVA